MYIWAINGYNILQYYVIRFYRSSIRGPEMLGMSRTAGLAGLVHVREIDEAEPAEPAEPAERRRFL